MFAVRFASLLMLLLRTDSSRPLAKRIVAIGTDADGRVEHMHIDEIAKQFNSSIVKRIKSWFPPSSPRSPLLKALQPIISDTERGMDENINELIQEIHYEKDPLENMDLVFERAQEAYQSRIHQMSMRTLFNFMEKALELPAETKEVLPQAIWDKMSEKRTEFLALLASIRDMKSRVDELGAYISNFINQAKELEAKEAGHETQPGQLGENAAGHTNETGET